MKKHFLLACMAILTILMTACSQEELSMGQGGNVVTIDVSVPQISTRAIGDGFSANKLYWGVYDHDGVLLTQISKTSDGQDFSGTGKVSLTLAKDKRYSVVFWAANADNSMCTVDWANRTMTVNPTQANQEAYDAFCAYLTIDNVSGYTSPSVTLYRPFAQINIGTADIEEASKSGLTVQNSKVEIEGLPNQYNFVTGEATGNCTFGYNYPTEVVTFANEEFPVGGYEYLSMNYALVSSDKELVTVKFTYQDDDNQEHLCTYSSVPVQRNWRTNIYGNILTSEADFTVSIEPSFADDSHNVEVWDGKTVEEPVIKTSTGQNGNQETTAEVSKASQLAYIAQMLLNGGGASNARATRSGESTIDYSKITIKLGANIDLGYEQWTPIGTSTNNFTGVLDGNGYTISNLKIVEDEAKEGKAYIGFFGYAKNATIKNVTFENVDINIPCLDIDHSQGHIGAVAGSLEGTSTIENVTVKGDIKVEATFDANGASRVAVVAGGNSGGNVTMKNVHVIANEGSYLKANNNVGALAGQLQVKNVFENCSSNIDVTGKKFFAGGLIGLAAGDSKFTNCHTTGNVTITAGREGRANDHYRVGGIAGGWADGKTKVCILENCSYTGTVSGTNADGSVANPLDYAGYVGRGYTLTNCAGSKVVIDGVSYIQAKDKVFGQYVVVGTEGVIQVANAADLLNAVNFVEDGQTIKLTGNVTFDKDNYTDNGGWKDGLGYAGDKSFTLDLGGYTVSQDGSLNDYLFWFKNVGSKANTITIKNGTLDAGTTAYCALCTANSHENTLTINTKDLTLINNISNGSTIKNRAGAILNIQAGTKITGKDSYLGIENWNSTVNIYDGAEIYMNGTSSYNGCLIGVGGNGTINVYGGYGNGVSGGIIAMTSGGTINVSGGEWIANTVGTNANDNKAVLIAQSDKQYNEGAGNAVVNVTGGTFKGGFNCYGNAVGDAQINITGGNFNNDPSAYVVAGYESTENAGTYTVGKPKALIALEEAIAKGGTVTLTEDVNLVEALTIKSGDVTLDLNGKTITAATTDAFVAKTGAKLTLKNGTITSHGGIARAVGGEIVIESGTYTQTGTAVGSTPSTYRYAIDAREGGKITVNGGEFTSGNGMINVGANSEMTINNGKFTNVVEKTMTRHFAYVSAKLTVNGGEFFGKANNGAGGCFFCGAASGCDIQITGGKFTSLWTSGSVNRIFEVYYGGTINVTGGMFNTNGGISSFVTENTDEATKEAYPYVAK